MAVGNYSHAEGGSTIAVGSYSHAEGLNATAKGDYSHAEGSGVIASGSYSHAEGINAIAIGNYSHAEGETTLSSGSYSHAEGSATTAIGLASHAEGRWTIANGDYQHVQGAFNRSNTNPSAFILGNGTSNINRSNLIYASGSLVQITGSLNISGSISITRDITGSNALFTGTISINNTLLINQNSASLTTGTKTLSSIATGSYTSAFYNYTVASGSNARSGQVMVVWNGGSIQYTDNSTLDIGSTTSVVFTASLSGANMNLTTVLPSDSWTVKTLINLL
jgi:hypothetical protein